MALDRGGRSPLHYAETAEEARSRIEAGDDPSLSDRDGYTPLHFAAQEGRLEVARILLGHGALVDKQDKHGNTPLWTAVFNSKGDGAMVRLLRTVGADPLRRNKYGHTPTSAARGIGNYDIARFLVDVVDDEGSSSP